MNLKEILEKEGEDKTCEEKVSQMKEEVRIMYLEQEILLDNNDMIIDMKMKLTQV